MTARALGHEYIVLTDHSPRLTIAHGLSVERLVQQLEVVPTIVSLREKLEAIRRAELERALARLPGAAEDTRRVMDALSQAIVNKVLHAPMVKLKDSSRAGHARRWTEMISELFGLRGSGPGRSG